MRDGKKAPVVTKKARGQWVPVGWNLFWTSFGKTWGFSWKFVQPHHWKYHAKISTYIRPQGKSVSSATV